MLGLTHGTAEHLISLYVTPKLRLLDTWGGLAGIKFLSSVIVRS